MELLAILRCKRGAPMEGPGASLTSLHPAFCLPGLHLSCRTSLISVLIPRQNTLPRNYPAAVHFLFYKKCTTYHHFYIETLFLQIASNLHQSSHQNSSNRCELISWVQRPPKLSSKTHRLEQTKSYKPGRLCLQEKKKKLTLPVAVANGYRQPKL